MSTRVRFTTSDLELLPDRLDDVRYEIIDGELFVSKQPRMEHQLVCSKVNQALANWNDEAGLGATPIAPGLIFSPHDNVAPDVVWISHARMRAYRDEGGHLRGAPELVVEVLSPGAENTRRDLEVKLNLYSIQGVLEYWVLDWGLHTVQVFRRQDAQLHLAATLGDGDTLTSLLLPGFACAVESLWLPRLESADD